MTEGTETRGRPVLGVSACLLGEMVRYNAGHKRQRFLTDTLKPLVSYVSICPEMAIGLGTPRPTLRLVGTRQSYQLVTAKTGANHTDAMVAFADGAMEQLTSQGVCGYIFKSRSPSCGLNQLPVYKSRESKSQIATQAGVGVYAQRLRQRFLSLPMIDERSLHDAESRWHFLEHVFARQRWLQLARQHPTRHALMTFHAAHKYQLLAHGQQAYKALGQILGNASHGVDSTELCALYGAAFNASFAKPATIAEHVNALQHICGYLRGHLDVKTRQDVRRLIDDYRRRMVPLLEVLRCLGGLAQNYDVPYIAQQTYLHPMPYELLQP